MKAKKNAPTGAGTPDQGATKGLSVRTEDTTSDKIQQVLRLFAELSRYAVIKTAALLLLLLAPIAVKAVAEPEIILIGVVAPAETPAIRYNLFRSPPKGSWLLRQSRHQSSRNASPGRSCTGWPGFQPEQRRRSG